MAINLIVYPTDNYNTFVDLTDALAVTDNFLDYDKWTDLADDDTRSRYLIDAFNTINTMSDITLPSTAEDDLIEAQCRLAIYRIDNDPLDSSVIGSESLGDYSVSYKKAPSSGITTIASRLLEQYKTSGGNNLKLERS